MLLLQQQAFAQASRLKKQFTLRGKLNTVHMDSVLLYYENTEGQEVFQSGPIFNDAFILRDTLSEPSRARILFKDRDEEIPQSSFLARSKEIYLEPRLMILTGDPSKLGQLKLSGSDSNDDLDSLNAATISVRVEMQPLLLEYRDEKDPQKAATILTKFEPYEDRIKAISYRFFLDHPNSYVTATQMQDFVAQVSLDSSRVIYNNFNPELKQSYYGQMLAAEIKKMESVLPGKMAPAFTATDANGKTVSLSDYKGQYILLDFWASWCPPCRKGNPHMVDLYKKYNDQCFFVVGIALDDNTQDGWKKAIEKDNLNAWPNLLSGAGTTTILAINTPYTLYPPGY